MHQEVLFSYNLWAVKPQYFDIALTKDPARFALSLLKRRAVDTHIVIQRYPQQTLMRRHWMGGRDRRKHQRNSQAYYWKCF